jgi:uncharacterized membrane protein
MTTLNQPLQTGTPGTARGDALSGSSGVGAVIRKVKLATRDRSHEGQNVGRIERIIGGVVGTGVVVAGMHRGGLWGWVMAGMGGLVLHRSVTGHSYTYGAVGMRTNTAAAAPGDFQKYGIHVQQSFSVNKPREELYRFWRQFDNLPSFMKHLESVRVLSDTRSHWVVKGPFGNVEWDAEIIHDKPDELIAWKSMANADVDSSGSVRFADGGNDRGTTVRVVLDYIPPAGKIGKYVAKLFGEEPTLQVREDLRRFKRLMETGEIPTTMGQPRGTCTGTGGTLQKTE